MTSVYALAVAVKAKGETKLHHRTIGFSGIVMTIFIALQSLYPLMPFYAIGCLLATCMIHSFVYKDEAKEYEYEIEIAKGQSVCQQKRHSSRCDSACRYLRCQMKED